MGVGFSVIERWKVDRFFYISTAVGYSVIERWSVDWFFLYQYSCWIPSDREESWSFFLYQYAVGYSVIERWTVDRFFIRPSFKTGRIMVYQCPTVGQSVRPSVWSSVRSFHMSRSNLRTPWPIHLKFLRVIGIDSLTVWILYGDIVKFYSRVMGLYSSNCREFFVCRAVN